MRLDEVERRIAAITDVSARWPESLWDGVFDGLVYLTILRTAYAVYFPETWIDIHGRRVYTIQVCEKNTKNIVWMNLGLSVTDLLKQAVERFEL